MGNRVGHSNIWPAIVRDVGGRTGACRFTDPTGQRGLSFGGVRGGFSYGATDEHGYEAVENNCHIHDWHATILHLLGLDHQQLTYHYAGRDFRLTDIHGNVVHEILA